MITLFVPFPFSESAKRHLHPLTQVQGFSFCQAREPLVTRDSIRRQSIFGLILFPNSASPVPHLCTRRQRLFYFWIRPVLKFCFSCIPSLHSSDLRRKFTRKSRQKLFLDASSSMDQQRVFDIPGLEATPGHMSAALHEMRQVTDEVSRTHTDKI